MKVDLTGSVFTHPVTVPWKAAKCGFKWDKPHLSGGMAPMVARHSFHDI